MMEKEFVLLVRKLEKKMHEVKKAELKIRGIGDLSASHGEILIVLFRYGDQPMNSLATSTNKDKSTITALVNKLIKCGYIEKYKDKDDSRVYNVRLTKKAYADREHFEAAADTLVQRISRFITPEELEATVKTMRKIHDSL